MEIERDMPECEKWNIEAGNVDDEKKTLMELMMGEEFHNYFWDEEHAL